VGDKSIWKKEISFGRKKNAEEPAAPAPAEASPVEAAPAAGQVPFWKKEIGGKKKAATAAPASSSMWKKEISLGRKKQKQVERLAEEAAQAVAPLPPEERPLAPMPIEAEVLPEPPAPVAPVVPQPLAVPEPVAAVEPTPQPPPPQMEVVYEAPVAPEPEVLYQAPPAPAPTGLEPLPEPPPPVEVEVEPPAPFAPAPVAPAPVAPVAPAPVAAEQPPAAVVPPAPQPVAAPAEPWEQPAVPPPAPAPAAPPVVVHPPVPAAELPPLPQPAPEPKVPFWKKEIGGKKKAQPAAAATAEAEPKVPFWKKEIGGKKKQQPATAAVATTGEPAEKKVPFWKKEFGAKKKAQPSTAAVPAAKAEKSGPFWKREFALKRPSLSMSRGAKSPGKKGGAKAKRVVGLKIGASQIAAARVTNNGHAELLQVARQPLELGVVVGGELRNPDALAEQLKAFFARHKLPKKNVRLGIASNRIGVRIFDVAGITDDKALNNAIQFRAQEALPIPLDEAVLDYHVLSESVDAEGNPTRRILLVVAYRELVDRYVSACRKAGITLLGIDLEAFALLRALAAPREEDVPANAALVAVAVGHDRSTFAVSDGRICEFTRVLEWGGSALNVALARALDLAPSEVESIKRSLTLDGTAAEAPAGLTQEQWATSLDAVRKQLQSFARELVSSLQFYQNQPGSLGIGEIVLTGGTAHLPGLADELQRLIGVRVRVGDPLARLKVAKKVASPEQLGSFAVAIGLGIED
jgi:type IV pilus assembly protein PilM